MTFQSDYLTKMKMSMKPPQVTIQQSHPWTVICLLWYSKILWNLLCVWILYKAASSDVFIFHIKLSSGSAAELFSNIKRRWCTVQTSHLPAKLTVTTLFLHRVTDKQINCECESAKWMQPIIYFFLGNGSGESKINTGLGLQPFTLVGGKGTRVWLEDTTPCTITDKIA